MRWVLLLASVVAVTLAAACDSAEDPAPQPPDTAAMQGPVPAPGVDEAATEPEAPEDEAAEAVDDTVPADDEEGTAQSDAEQASPPLPEWARDARELRFERREVADDERLLVQVSCTSCDVGGSTIGAWRGGEVGWRYVLFPGTDGWSAVSEEGPFALVDCVVGYCTGEGVPGSVERTLYVSDDGWRWEAVGLPKGDWVIEPQTLREGRLVLTRSEQTGQYGWERTTVERVEWPSMAQLPLEDALLPAVFLPPRGGVAAGRYLWTVGDASDPEGRASDGLYRSGELLWDLSPYEVAGIAPTRAGEGLLVAVRCDGVQLHAKGLQLAGCHASFGHTAYLLRLDLEARVISAYAVDLTSLLQEGPPPAPGSPALANLFWQDDRLWGYTWLDQPELTFRPAIVDLDTGVLRSFSENGARYSFVAPIRLEPSRAMEAFAELPGCVQLRSMPYAEAEAVFGGCVTAGVLTGESAVDVAGGEWVFVASDAAAGWAPADAVPH